jgi:hypothetical protein
MITATIDLTIPAAPVAMRQGAPSREDIRNQVRQSVLQARDDMRQAADELQISAMRDAEQALRQAEQQLRSARTDDQVGAAEQAVAGAVERLKELDVERGRVVGERGETRAHTIQPPMMPRDMIPPQAVDIAMGFFTMCAVMVVGWPLARAFGRRIERGGKAAAVAGVPSEQLQRIEQAVESMAIEVERISESQRFMAKLQGAPAAEQAPVHWEERR